MARSAQTRKTHLPFPLGSFQNRLGILLPVCRSIAIVCICVCVGHTAEENCINVERTPTNKGSLFVVLRKYKFLDAAYEEPRGGGVQAVGYGAEYVKYGEVHGNIMASIKVWTDKIR